MKFWLHAVFESILLFAVSVLWCEVGYYYYIFKYNCSGWPGQPSEIGNDKPNHMTRILVVADTHIMGPVKSVRLDKLRREWQMEQAYSISNIIYQPDVVLFLGDLFDEASFSLDAAFEDASRDFDRIFPIHDNQDRIIIAGNHDVGFHNQMTHFPHLIERFYARYFATSSAELIKIPTPKSTVNIVDINSMSFYNDTCPYCTRSIAATNQIANQLKNEGSSEHQSIPILLTHIPLYRLNDTQCRYPSSLRETVKKTNVEGEDVLHATASRFLLERLRPRLVISGHTHMECSTEHTLTLGETFREQTISSYNHKYAEYKPGFLLLSANSTHLFTRHCHLVEEWIIATIYAATIVTVISRIFVLYNRSNQFSIKN